MSWIKLPNVGDSHECVVESTEPGRGNADCFRTTDGDVLYIDRSVALARLREIGIPTIQDAHGQSLRFSRIAPSHWMIERAHGEAYEPPTGQPMTEQKAEPPRNIKADRRAEIADAYAWAMETAIATQTAKMKGKGMPKPTADSINAGAATLLINAERRNAI